MTAAETRAWLTENIEKMNGWLTKERAIQMFDLVLNEEASVLVEIGVFAGRSLVAQALALKQLGRGKIYGIDAWDKHAAYEGEQDENAQQWWFDLDLPEMQKECFRMVQYHKLQDYVVLIQSKAHECHQIMPMCDILYIDGNHNEVSSCRDVKLYLPKVKQNGYVWIDDVDWPQTQKALKMLERECVLVNAWEKYRLYIKGHPDFPPNQQ